MQTYSAIVIRCRAVEEQSEIYCLDLIINQGYFSAKPGQYVLLKPSNNRSVMPRPFSVVDIHKGILTILFKIVGENTKAYSKLKTGDRLEVMGPYGAEIPIDRRGAGYVLVGGGVGAAALIMLSEKMDGLLPCHVLLGAKNRNEIVSPNFFHDSSKVKMITEQNLDGFTDETNGLVTDLLPEYLRDNNGNFTVVACGPKPMLRKTAEICAEYGNPCLVMVEEMMACGMGACLSCAVHGIDGTVRHACKDGPAIDAGWIDWDKFMPKRAETGVGPHVIDMRVELGRLKLKPPIMNSSGCLSLAAIKNGSVYVTELGALVTKGVTVEPRTGNSGTRVCETPSGMINSIGLENIGIEKFLEKELPDWLRCDKPVIVNISGFSVEDYAELASRLNSTGIAGIEVNISCPNVKHGGMLFGVDPTLAFAVTSRVRKATDKFLIVKLTPNVADIVLIARAAVDAGADAISLINTVQAMAIDPLTRRPKIGMVYGGLSGPAIRPIAVRMVHQLRKANLGVPIIGMGGIEDAASAAEFFIAGADAVAVGTGCFSNHRIADAIRTGLEDIIRQNGFSSVRELTGSLVTH